MTIRFLKPWNGYQPDAVVSGLTNEAALIAGGLASYDLDGGNDGRTYEAKFATDASGNVTGLVGPAGEIFTQLQEYDGTVPELEPVDWFPDRYLNADDTFLYGHASGSAFNFVRTNKVTRVTTTVTNPFSLSTGGIRSIVVTSVPGLLIAGAGSTASGQASMRIFRSTDYGDTWSLVLTLGSGTNGATTDVWLLSDRNFCEGNLGWYIGEYNVHPSRTSGGANDGVTLWKSTDNGATWTENQVWNTGGVNIYRHIHALKFVDNRVIICTGDSDAGSALIGWDEVTPIGSVAFSALTVPVQYGSQRYRIVDAVEADGNLYYMSDGSTESTVAVSDVGWFTVPADLSEQAVRLDGKISAFPLRSIYYAAKFSSGATCYIEELVNTVTSEFNYGIWVSNEDRTHLERAGCIRISTATTGQIPPTMFQRGDVVYVSFNTAALGKGTTVGTAAFTVSATKRWAGMRPDTVHPVYWVNPVTGADNADTGRGFYPGLPWASVEYALESNRVHQGGRVMLPSGDWEELNSIAINTDQTNADPASFTTLEGAGINTTKHSLAAASAQPACFLLGAEQVRFEVKDIHLSTKRNVSTQAIFTGNGANTAQTLRFIRARIGGKDIPVGNVVLNLNLAAGGSVNISAYDAQFCAQTRTDGYLFTGDADGPCNFTGVNCVFDGGRGAFNPAAADVINIKDSLFTNYTVTAIRAQATASVVPVLKDCRFHSFVALPQWIDDGTLVEAAQWTNARCTSPLSPASIFDGSSEVDLDAAPRDPRIFDYSRCDV